MRSERAGIFGAAAITALAISFLAAPAAAGPRGVRFADFNGGNGPPSVNLTVQQVTVRPIRAHVGDVIEIEAVIDNREEGSDTTWAEVYAGRKVVASEAFRWGVTDADRTYRLSMRWDTKGMAPGEYRIRVEALVPHDVSPFDNELALKEPVILVEPGGKFPGGQPPGGSATETDPRY